MKKKVNNQNIVSQTNSLTTKFWNNFIVNLSIF